MASNPAATQSGRSKPPSSLASQKSEKIYHTLQRYTIPYKDIPYHRKIYDAIPYNNFPIPYEDIPYHAIPYHSLGLTKSHYLFASKM